jgi:3-phenylpropionate/trans-cinnamate dioxygenase ferredoxin reductase component
MTNGNTMADVVIIGAGHAGVAAAAELHKRDANLNICLISNELPLPYHRPPLSKKCLFDVRLSLELLQAEGFYEAQNIHLHRGATVTHIDRTQRKVKLADGQVLTYTQLIIATGSSLRSMPVEGGERALGVYNYADIQHLGPKLQAANNVVVIGGGFIGCEIAAGALKLGKNVSLLVSGPRLLRKAIAPAMGARVTQLHKNSGMHIHTDCQVSHLDDDGVHTNHGLFRGDLIIAGVGANPNIQLAKQAGLTIDGGIVVNAFGHTSDAHIYAVGDVASMPLQGKIQRLESIQNANDQAQSVANNIIAHRLGEPAMAYNPVPWFWSDQGDLKLQMVGFNDANAEQKTLASDSDTRMTAVQFSKGVMTGVDTLNMPSNHLAARKLLAMSVDITWDMVQDHNQDLKQLFKHLR